ncbi:LacI family DNA-binding transcriptional regulator [Noviherbaspirillum malthae]|uniref:LacI family DNA-binding transcriptional regulator n=1 Tax=Noviherbaspirillum malthae TaxID=1260987 RepID=UPI00188FF092|nr:substrate-binding domain-containing protein [Noviherbaspirillum malthae]
MNLKRFAQSLNLSETTVSRALNGYPEVSERTRERVLAAAKAVGYQPSSIARGLAVGRTNAVGMILPALHLGLGKQTFLNFLSGITRELDSRGMNFFMTPPALANPLESYEQFVRSQRFDGIVLTHCGVQDERIAYLAKQGMPFVAHGRSGDGSDHAWLDYDNPAGMRLATTELLSLGHKRIAYIGDSQDLSAAAERFEAFTRCMQEAGLGTDPRMVMSKCTDHRSGYQAMQNLLHCSPRPTAVIADNHLAGAGAMRAMLDADIAVGRDISLIVWGDLSDYHWSMRPASIVEPRPEEAGRKIIEMLMKRIDGTPASELQVLWPLELVAGDTIGQCVE